MGEQPVSRLLDLVGDVPAQGAQQGVPPYHTPVFIPAHPRHPGGGAPPRIDYELLTDEERRRQHLGRPQAAGRRRR
ncbi:hypothetical protein [Streptomyces sp. NPDC006691]|uniref:hypothetical protein n=1 Tax=Streptomyces sp. NPDC006691 TaxID=3364757 RepID=UPI00369CFE7E